MKLTYFRGDPPNFGDEINGILWPHLLPPGFLDDDEDELFLGAGSILYDFYPSGSLKNVMGSGFGGYTDPPDISGPDWNVVWVRGPLTAARLGLDPSLAICDAAILLREIPLPPPEPGISAAFMPHFDSVARGDWGAVCRLAGVTYLDPRDDPARLIACLRGADLVVTEAMHGAIIADALRTPWVPVLPFHAAHRMKWLDWAQSLDIDLQPARLSPSTLLEAYTFATGLRGRGRSARLLRSRMSRPVNTAMRHRAAHRLRWLVEAADPQLSSDAAINRATSRCLEAIDGFVSARADALPMRQAGS
ncbi:pyruvyl transferase [Rhodobacterales bacterium HKCCE3408]|nr:pyruvyl transferase [Rhodobacterales bacterium HKCCE3408]